jgi:putative ABC transport system substrate-binding protein
MVRIAQQQTTTIPIVIAVAGDVFANGLATNLAHPEGNTTGVTNLFAPIVGKWVELLKEAVPRLERVGYIYEPFSCRLPCDPRGARKGIAGSRLTNDLDTFQQRPGARALTSMPSPPSQMVDWSWGLLLSPATIGQQSTLWRSNIGCRPSMLAGAISKAV